jgi:hypothetical protein
MEAGAGRTDDAADSGGVGGGSAGSGGSTGGSGGAAGHDAGTGGAGGPDAAGGGGCPATEPKPGERCERAGLACQYGDDPRSDTCRTTYDCVTGVWSPRLTGCRPLPSPTMCPATRAEAQGQSCAPAGAFCKYGDLQCECTSCPSGSPVCQIRPPTWTCAAPQQTPGCPNAEPNLGTSCGSEGARCSYQCDHQTRVCQGGLWIGQQSMGCPRSNRAVKRDVRYLDQAALRRVSEEILATKLATWEYRDVALAGKRHLGFIIEDQPGSQAVDRNGSMVDLYDYTSMLLAATKVQAQELRRLEREVADLKKQLRPRRAPKRVTAGDVIPR